MEPSHSTYRNSFGTKLGVRKRKPRPASLIEAANDRLRLGCLKREQNNSQRDVHIKTESPKISKPPTEPSASGEESTKRKGLRHFAVRVCKKVEEKQYTSYNEVADELVIEEKRIKEEEVANGTLTASVQKKIAKGGALVDEKNIRRRVYDSLNVLMAMGVIEKNKKVIRWKGLSMARADGLHGEIANARSAVEEQRRVLEEKRAFCRKIDEQATDLATVVARNRKSVRLADGVEDLFPSAQRAIPLHRIYQDRISVPFLLVCAGKDTNIALKMDRSCEDICFTFSSEFSILDDRETIRRMRVRQQQSPSSVDWYDEERFGLQLMEPISQPISPHDSPAVPMSTNNTCTLGNSLA